MYTQLPFSCQSIPSILIIFFIYFPKTLYIKPLQQYFIYYVSSPFIHTCQCLMTFCLENKRVGLYEA